MQDYEIRAIGKVNSSLNMNERLSEGAMGLCGEAGEVTDLIKKYLYQGHELKLTELCEELGDVLWYIIDIASTVGISFETIQQENIKKLDKRYPNGFSSERSINRSKK